MTISTSLESLNLNDLLDVSINNPADDDVLTYNSVLQRWENTAGGWVPTSRLITINGVTQDLSADRTWTISVGAGSGTVTSVSGTGTVSGLTLSGSVTTAGNLTLGGTLVLTSGNITSGLGYTPYDASNPSNYITSSALSAYLTIASASSTYLTIANAASTYQPIFTTQNGLTYGGGNLELGGSLIKNTTIGGNGSGGPYYLYLQRFTELKLNADDSNTSTEIYLTPTQMQVKTPLYGSKSVGDVLTLKDPASGEVEFETPATGGGGLLFGTASGTDTYTVTISGATAYADGDAYIIRFTNGNTTGATLDISSFGAKTLYRNNDGPLLGGDILDGAEMLVIYNSVLDAFDCIGTSPNSLFSYVTNDDTVSITKGQPVYASGGTGDRLKVKLAYNTSDSTSAQTIGLVYSASIASGQKGIIMIQGLLDGLTILPTASWSDGDPVYLGATAGAITKTKPSAPNHLVYLGFVTSASNGSSGRLYVKVQNGYELDEIHNVDLVSTAPVNNDVLVFDTSTTPDLWKPKSIPTILGYTPANIDSPAFTGTPTAPTAAEGTSTTQIATTAFVRTEIVNSGITTLDSTTTPVSVVNTATNTLVYSLLIPADFLKVSDIITIFSNTNSSVTNGNSQSARYYINTSASLTGAQLVGTFTNTVGTSDFYGFTRQLYVTAIGGSGNLKFSPSNSSSSLGFTGNINSNIQNLTVDTTVDQYLILAMQMGTNTFTCSLETLYVELRR
jgi:hypothetical protein